MSGLYLAVLCVFSEHMWYLMLFNAQHFNFITFPKIATFASKIVLKPSTEHLHSQVDGQAKYTLYSI